MMSYYLRKHYTWILVGIVLAIDLLSGLLIGSRGASIAIIFFGFVIVLVLLQVDSTTLLVLWIFGAPFLQGSSINLGAGFPDVTFDRTMIFILVLKELLHSRSIESTSNKLSLRNNLGIILFFAFLIYGVISIIFIRTDDIIRQFYLLFDVYGLPFMMFWVVRRVIKREGDVKKIVVASMVVIFVLAAPTFLEIITKQNLLGQPTQFIDGVWRVRSFTDSPWELGTFLTMLLPLPFHVVLTDHYPKKYRGWAVLVIAIGIGATILTFMRATWLCLVIGLGLISVMEPRLRKYLPVALLLIAIIVIALGPSILETQAWQERVTDLGTINSRITVIKAQLTLFLEKPFFGQGVGMTPERYFVGVSYSEKYMLYYGATLPSHNMYLNHLLQFGVMGILYFGAILLVILGSFKTYRKARAADYFGKTLYIVLWASVLMFLIQALTFETRFFPSFGVLFWLLMAVLRFVTMRGQTDFSLNSSQKLVTQIVE